MFADPDKEVADYSKRLFDAVLNTVIGLDGDGTGVGGYVRPDVVRDVLADVAAVIDNNAQVAKSAADRRRLSNEMAKRYETMAKSMATADASGSLAAWTKARPVPSSSSHQASYLRRAPSAVFGGRSGESNDSIVDGAGADEVAGDASGLRPIRAA